MATKRLRTCRMSFCFRNMHVGVVRVDNVRVHTKVMMLNIYVYVYDMI